MSGNSSEDALYKRLERIEKHLEMLGSRINQLESAPSLDKPIVSEKSIPLQVDEDKW